MKLHMQVGSSCDGRVVVVFDIELWHLTRYLLDISMPDAWLTLLLAVYEARSQSLQNVESAVLPVQIYQPLLQGSSWGRSMTVQRDDLLHRETFAVSGVLDRVLAMTEAQTYATLGVGCWKAGGAS